MFGTGSWRNDVFDVVLDIEPSLLEAHADIHRGLDVSTKGKLGSKTIVEFVLRVAVPKGKPDLFARLDKMKSGHRWMGDFASEVDPAVLPGIQVQGLALSIVGSTYAMRRFLALHRGCLVELILVARVPYRMEAVMASAQKGMRTAAGGAWNPALCQGD